MVVDRAALSQHSKGARLAAHTCAFMAQATMDKHSSVLAWHRLGWSRMDSTCTAHTKPLHSTAKLHSKDTQQMAPPAWVAHHKLSR
eukprot:scaffold115375_cov22-Tisochrysis_lutea.AAC.2